MSPTGASSQHEEHSAEREKDKAGKGKGSSKSKDLSHVPCKFFKVGGCTAGPACPFSHHATEPGETKNVCSWFVKGSCKFGHKCALAHILPGQPMSMDKRNKRAAQTANGGKSGEKGSGGHGRERGRRGAFEGDNAGRSRERRSTATQGASPPIGMGIGSRAPITISKAAPTPAALSDALSGPALKDTDFPFGLPDDLDELTATPRQPPPRQFSPVASATAPPPAEPSGTVNSNLPPTARSAAVPPTTVAESQRRPSPLPLARSSGSVARIPRNNAPVDFGPVGSPPQASPGFIPGHVTRSSVNGFSPGTSPPVRNENPAPFGSSPFSAPGSKSLFLSYSLDKHEASRQTGAFDVKWGDNKRTIRARDLDNAVEDEDLEEFLPSSLTDLLSPGERERRMSRTKHGARASVDHQLFSRSVPSSNMLDIKSIWDEQNKPRGRDADASTSLNNAQTRGVSHGRYGEEDSQSASSSLMGTSNVSAGFLSHVHRPAVAAGGMRTMSAQSFEQNNLGVHGNAQAAPDFIISASIDPVSTLSGMHSRPIPGGQKAGLSSALSPSTQALRNHAPGQSLPQGLAAGISRLHLVPAGSPSNGQYDWSPDGPRLGTTPRAYDPFSLEDNTPPRPTFSTLNNRTGPSPSGLSMSRTPSSSSQSAMPTPSNAPGNPTRRWQGNAWASPLAEAVRTNDEDEDLFPMD
ncbi:hypothetical protein BDV93DRAFT_518284 [Ceratobasidium sp. AG-I]|nr:hypothetical protein BDV93DRAFT_518284 [Ceratobasidium sp. AG-I]